MDVKPTASVRGYRAYDEPARLSSRAPAFVIDFSLFSAVFCLIFRVFNLSLLPSAWLGAAFAVLVAATVAAQKWYLGGTIGQLVWRQRMLGPDRRPPEPASGGLRAYWAAYRGARACQHEKLGAPAVATGILLTLTAFAGAVWMAREALWKHPLLIRAGELRLPPFAPPQGDAWTVIPLFYTLGAWPARFEGRPVLYSLPYEKGPPDRFVGRIIARWEAPDVQVTIEGPKTPDGAPEADRLRDCVTAPWDRGQGLVSCLRARERALMRHVQGIREIGPRDWDMRWFEVDNPSLEAGERPRGVYLAGWNATRAQERYILMTSRGTYQAFIVDRPRTSRGDAAHEIAEQAIRSLRLTDDLAPGRLWVDRELGSIRLDTLEQTADTETFVGALSRVQALLLAKISVDPRTYDSYFHLGGTAMLLARHSLKNGVSEWSATAAPMAQSVSRYARDLAPADPRTRQLEELSAGLRKR
jgi:hypothetical protein